MKFNPLSWPGSFVSTIIKLFVLIIVVGSVLFLLYTPEGQTYMSLVPDLVSLEETDVQVQSFDSEKIKDFYDSIITNETLDNLNGQLPKITNLTCEGDDCEIEISYDTIAGAVNETIEMVDDMVMNFSSEYIQSKPDKTIYNGQTTAIVTGSDQYSTVNSSLQFSIDLSVNCNVNDFETDYALYPNGNIYIVLNNQIKPSNCIEDKKYMINVPLLDGYKINGVYVTSPQNQRIN